MALGGTDRRRRSISDINVTPLVDVMLVLLIIFMVTAPMMQQGIPVNLPKAKAKAMTSEREEKLVITLRKDRRIYLNRQPVSLEVLSKRLRTILKLRENKEVYLRADEALPYGFVVEAMAAIKEAGVNRLGLITEPLEER